MPDDFFRSNLTAPDLLPHFQYTTFRHHFNHLFLADPDFDPRCGFWTPDEAAILYNVAKQIGGRWLDIGARTGWTAAHLLMAESFVVSLEPELIRRDFRDRTRHNLAPIKQRLQCLLWSGLSLKSAEYFAMPSPVLWRDTFGGFVIDGDHSGTVPYEDALGCLSISKPDSVILFHDLWGGGAIYRGAIMLQQHGFRVKPYFTPNGIALCWRGYNDFVPPDHHPDPQIEPAVRLRMAADGFPLEAFHG